MSKKRTTTEKPEKVEQVEKPPEKPKYPLDPPGINPPNWLIALARVVNRRYGVPVWVTYLAAWTGSRYGKEQKGVNNATGYKASGTEKKNSDGYALFGNRRAEFGRLGINYNTLGFEGLAKKYPHIKDCDPKHFMEA